MSLSGLIEQVHLPKVAVLAAVLETYKNRWVAAQTVEQRLGVEAEAMALYQRMLSRDFGVDDVTPFDHLDAQDFDEFYGLQEQLLFANSAMMNRLMEMYITRFNNQQISIGEIVGQVRRIKQKHAVLNLWNNAGFRHFIAERFLNSEALATNHVSVDACEVHANQGMLTLPVQIRERVPVSALSIGPGSNGTPGSSDVEVTTTNQELSALLGSSPGWFEYERMDVGPCKLVLHLELMTPQVVNHINVVPADIGVPISFEIADVVFTTSAKESISIHKLFPDDYADDFFNVPVAGASDGWECSFLPVEAVGVSITFIQTQGYSIETAASDGTPVVRERFAIPLRTVSLFRNQYKASGGINSFSTPLRKNLYAVEPIIQASPDNRSFYDLLLEVSFDGGTTWKLAATDDATQINLIDADDRNFVWRLTVNRVDSVFSTLTSFSKPTDVRGDVKTTLKTVSRFNSPTTISLGSQPRDNSVFVIQPKVGRRGKKAKAFKLGSTTSGTTKLRMPFNVLKAGVRPEEARVYVGGTEYSRKNPGETVSALEWSFSDDHNEIVVSNDLPPGTQVDVVLDDELMQLEEREDGYYHRTALSFDPDKSNIDVTYLAREPARATVLLKRGLAINYLGYENILAGTLEITSTNGDTYTEVDSRDEVYDAADLEYYVDYANGIVYLATPVGDDNVRVSFDYQPTLELSKSDFSIAYVDGRPWGLRIHKNALEAVTVEEAISDENTSILNPITKAYEARVEVIPNGSQTKKQLSYSNIIKGTFMAPVDLLENELVPEEVDFVDGTTEFLGLTPIEDERTVATAANGSGVVSFTLSARSLWYDGLGVTFSNTNVFTTLVASAAAVTAGATGSYFIDNDGTVYVKVGVGNSLQANIRMSYYFKDETFDPSNKYSVDYVDGILYSYDNLNQDAVVKYKTAYYMASYDLANELTDVQYSPATNSVQVRTENMDAINNLVKVVWEEQPIPQVNPTLQQYFSPLISMVGWRFS